MTQLSEQITPNNIILPMNPGLNIMNPVGIPPQIMQQPQNIPLNNNANLVGVPINSQNNIQNNIQNSDTSNNIFLIF